MAVKHGARRLRLLNRLTKYLKVWDHLLCILYIVLYKYCIIFISDISRPENIHHPKKRHKRSEERPHPITVELPGQDK